MTITDTMLAQAIRHILAKREADSYRLAAAVSTERAINKLKYELLNPAKIGR